MEYSVTNMFAEKMTESVYVKAFAQGVETEQRELAPLVSVLLASYNHEKYVEAAVRSVMAQKGVAFELIVVDDGSTDSSPQILEGLQAELGFKYIRRENKGFVPTMNELLSYARGKYFCSFASDDIMPPDRLKKQSQYLEAHPGSVACYGQIVNMSPEGQLEKSVDRRFVKSVPSISFEELFLGKKALHGCSEMYVLSKILDLGGYDERFFFEDIPLNLKILYECGPQPVLDDIVCCYYRQHGDNLHMDSDRIYSEIMNILELYRNHRLYKQAVSVWKSNWFSSLVYQDRLKAVRSIPKLGTPSLCFAKRLAKIFVPRFLLKY